MIYQQSIQKRLIWFFCIAAFLPLITLGVTSYYQSSDIVNNQMRSYNKYAIKQLKIVMDSSLEEMDYITRDVVSYLLSPSREINYQPTNYRELTEKYNLINYLKVYSTSNVRGLFVITPSKDVYGNKDIKLARLYEKYWWSQDKIDNYERYWVGFHDADYYWVSSTNGPTISLTVPIRLESAVPKGSFILVDLKADSILESLRSFEQDTQSVLTIFSSSGDVIYRTKDDVLESTHDLVWSETIDLNGWKIEVRVPVDEFQKSSDTIRNNLILVSGLSLIMAFILSHLFSRRITDPIVQLDQSMIKVSQGDFSTKIRIVSNDELGRLATRFNFMTEQVQDLITTIRRKENQRNEAELRALHYQINPHLMLNTLNAIQWKAKMSGDEDIQHMIFHLTKVLSESLNYSQELITLDEELITIDHFLKIQEYRFGKVFKYEQNIPHSVKTCLIPRMSLQPLLENIFFHAFSDGEGVIRLSVERNDNEMVMELHDNGRGTSNDKLSTLYKPPSPSRKGQGGLGLYNVDQKFKLHYGPQYGLKVHSKEGVGTTITMNWPYEEDK